MIKEMALALASGYHQMILENYPDVFDDTNCVMLESRGYVTTYWEYPPFGETSYKLDRLKFFLRFYRHSLIIVTDNNVTVETKDSDPALGKDETFHSIITWKQDVGVLLWNEDINTVVKA